MYILLLCIGLQLASFAIVHRSGSGRLLLSLANFFLLASTLVVLMVPLSGDRIWTLSVSLLVVSLTSLGYSIHKSRNIVSQTEVKIPEHRLDVVSDCRVIEADIPLTETPVRAPVVCEQDHDLTALELQLETLRNSERVYRRAWEGLPDESFIMDPEGRYQLVNQSLSRALGSEPTLVQGKIISDFRPDETSRKYLNGVREVLQGRSTEFTSEEERNGSPIVLAVRMVPIRSDSGQVEGALGLCRDITQKVTRERAQRHVEKLDGLGKISDAICKDLASELETALESTARLLRDLKDPKVVSVLRRIEDRTKAAVAVVKRLSSFSTTGLSVRQPVRVHSLIKDLVSRFSTTLPSGVTVEVKLEAQDDLVVGDPNGIQSALGNLCGNSQDALPNGGNITISTKEMSIGSEGALGSGNYLQILVEDNGHGMSPEIASRALEPYFTTKKSSKGMGLSAAYGVVKSHRGDLRVSSQTGKGTQVSLLLPLTKEVPSALPSVQLGSQKLLVVEDEEGLAEVYKFFLESLSYPFLMAHDGLEAIQLYREGWGSIRLVLLDLTLPKVGGREVFLAMKAINPKVKVLIVTGNVQDPRVAEMESLGALGVLQKPFNRAVLGERIHQLLNQPTKT